MSFFHRTAALCALVGQALGTLAGDTLFLMLESAGVLTLSGQFQVVSQLINQSIDQSIPFISIIAVRKTYNEKTHKTDS